MTSTTSTANASSPAAPSTAVDILSTPTSLFYTNLHPILLASILIFSFKSLVSDPVSTLIGLAPTVALLQAAYCVLCLPSSAEPRPKAPKPGQKKKDVKQAQDLGAKIVPVFLSFVLTLFLSAPLLYIILILFGAPLTSHHPHTLLLALHLALLTTPPLFYVHGLAAPTWTRLVSLQQPIDEISGAAIGACFGAWVGAVPIPLDWDRQWQRWPVTIICGLYGGTVLGKLAGAYLIKGKTMKLA